MDISKDWTIENIYYYEWKNEIIQKMNFSLAKDVASFFNQTIVAEYTENTNKLTIK